MSNVIDLLQILGLEGELPRGPRPTLPLSAVMAPGRGDEDEDEDEDDGEENSLTPRRAPLRRVA